MLGLVMYDVISGANCGAVPEYYGMGIKQLYYMISQGMASAFLRREKSCKIRKGIRKLQSLSIRELLRETSSSSVNLTLTPSTCFAAPIRVSVM